MPVVLPKEAENAKKRERTIRPAKPSRTARKNYERAITEQVRLLKAQTANLSDLIASGADRATVARAIATMAAEAQARAQRFAPGAAQAFVMQTDAANKTTLEKSIASAFGVDFANIIDTPDIAGDLQMAITRNVGLIESISQQHFAEVSQAVLDNYRGVPLPDGLSLTKRLQKIGGISENRARFIARDQTAKLTADLNSSRQTAVGIDEYIWRTARDQRVVGTPGGLYPVGSRGHENHYAREGKRFRWDNPPDDGPPGHAYNCRCYSEPVVDLDKMKAQYV